MSAWVSSLDFWSRNLDSDEASKVYSFYKPMVEASRDSKDKAELSFYALRYMAPNAYKQCFNRDSSVQDLFKRRTCDEEV